MFLPAGLRLRCECEEGLLHVAKGGHCLKESFFNCHKQGVRSHYLYLQYGMIHPLNLLHHAPSLCSGTKRSAAHLMLYECFTCFHKEDILI